METFKQKINYDNESIIQQAQIYTDQYRVIMEYIDNSIDAAEDYYDSESNSYSKEIQISIVKSNSKKNPEIMIADNCTGMKITPDTPLTIFRSAKKNDIRTNGMFGFGLFSCFSLCNCLTVTTKLSNSESNHSFKITPQTFKVQSDQELEIDIRCNNTNGEIKSSGTVITLADFNPGVYEDIDFKRLKEEIEIHFELIISRNNIKITLNDSAEGLQICKQFLYASFCEKPFTTTIKKLHKTNSKRYKTKSFYDISKTPVKIFLVAAKDTILNRNPFFVINGRRVIEISKVDQFRTKNKLSIWSRSNVTGFIDVTGVLEPIPSRKDFKKTELSKAFFHTLSYLEKEIKEYIESESRLHLPGRFSKLESMLNKQIQNFLSRFNRNNNYSDLQSFKEYKIQSYSENIATESNASETSESKSAKKSKSSKDNTAVKNKRKRNKYVFIKFPVDEFHSDEVIKSLKIKIDNSNDPDKSIDGHKFRSVFLDGAIIIFQKHDEFQKRLHHSSKGYFEINDKLIHYIALEIITHLQKMTFKTTGERNEMIFENFVSLILEFEDELKNFTGQKI